MMQVTITSPDPAAITKPAADLLEQMRLMEIDSIDICELVSQEVRKCARMKAALEEQRKKITRPLDEAKKATLDLFRPAISFLDEAETIGAQKVVAYQRKLEDERRRQQQEAEAAMRKERERLAREAAEAQAKADAEAAALREQAAAAAAAGRAAEAAKLEAKAESKEDAAEAKAANLQAEAAAIPQTVLMPAVPKMPGLSSRENWDFEITNADLIPRMYLIPNEHAIRQVVKALKAKTDIAGIRVFDRGTVAVSKK